MPELMRRNFHTQMAQDRFVDRDRNGSLTPWLAVAGVLRPGFETRG
jgi:hypothetical protein